MKKVYLLWILSALFGFVSTAAAQDKPRTEPNEKRTDGRPQVTPLRVQVIFTEFDGEKKIGSLPYTLHVNANSRPSSVRMGLRVPVQTVSSSPTQQPQFQYIDMGTNIDGSAEKADDGRFNLRLTVERSSAYSSTGQKLSSIGGSDISTQPVIQQFKATADLTMRDGQTIQSTISTDPVTGRTLKVDVTLNVVK